MASRMRSLMAVTASHTRWARGRGKGAALSLFHAPTAEWKDQLKAQRMARRTPISAFVQQQYQQFVRSHPHMDHCGLQRPRVVSPMTRTAAAVAHPRDSYLKSRLQRRNRPQATARRNSLLRSQQPLQSKPVAVRVRTGRSKRARDSAAKRFAQAKRHAAQPLHRVRIRPKTPL